MDYPYGGYGGGQDREIQEALGLLKHLEKEELSELLNDNEKRMSFVKSLSKISNLEEERNALIEENKRIAESNLACESNYSIQRQALMKSLEECQKLKDDLFTKKTKLCEFGRQNSMDTTMALMQAAMQEAEEESDEVAKAFLEKEMSIEQFIKEFVEKRKVYHSRRVKVDKMPEQIESSQQQASGLGSTPIRPAPLPPQNLPFSSMSISNSAPYPMNNVMPMPSYK